MTVRLKRANEGHPMLKKDRKEEFLWWFKRFHPHLSEPQAEYRFHRQRMWRFDWAWPDEKIAVEVHGSVFVPDQGHSSGMGITRDIEKANVALMEGWRVVSFTTTMIERDPEGCCRIVGQLLEQNSSRDSSSIDVAIEAGTQSSVPEIIADVDGGILHEVYSTIPLKVIRVDFDEDAKERCLVSQFASRDIQEFKLDDAKYEDFRKNILKRFGKKELARLDKLVGGLKERK